MYFVSEMVQKQRAIGCSQVSVTIISVATKESELVASQEVLCTVCQIRVLENAQKPTRKREASARTTRSSVV